MYDEHALSVSGGVELGYWLAKLEAEPHGGMHTLVVLMNTMTTTLLKMLPDTTYILLDDVRDLDDQITLGSAPTGIRDATHFPNIVTVRSVEELSAAFADVLREMEERSGSEAPGLALAGDQNGHTVAPDLRAKLHRSCDGRSCHCSSASESSESNVQS